MAAAHIYSSRLFPSYAWPLLAYFQTMSQGRRPQRCVLRYEEMALHDEITRRSFYRSVGYLYKNICVAVGRLQSHPCRERSQAYQDGRAPASLNELTPKNTGTYLVLFVDPS